MPTVKLKLLLCEATLNNYFAIHGVTINLGMMPVELIDEGEARTSIRYPIEGKFGEAKRRYSLGHFMVKLESTSKSVIGLIAQ